MPAKLLFRDAQGRDGAVELRAEPVYIGRAVECAVRTDDAMVSRRHSLVTHVDGRYWIEDLGSSNGTHVNDVRVQRQALHHNDVVRCGSLWLRYVEEAPAAQPMAPMAPPTPAPPVMASPGAGMPAMPLVAPPSIMGQPPPFGAAGLSPPQMPPVVPPGPPTGGTPFAPTPFVPSIPTPEGPAPVRTVSLKPQRFPGEAMGKPQTQDFGEPTNVGAAHDEVMSLRHELDTARQAIAELHAARDAAVAENRRLRAELDRVRSELERIVRELAGPKT